MRSPTAVLIGALILGFLGLPASANTVAVEITAGVLSFYDVGDGLIDSVDLGEATPCAAQDGMAAAAGGSVGTVASTVVLELLLPLGPTPLVAHITLAVDGVYSGSGTGVSLGGDLEIDLWEQDVTCTKVGDPCEIEAADIGLVGEASPATLPNLTGVTMTLDGGNEVFETAVAGDCGDLGDLDGGYVELSGLELSAV